LTHSLFSK